MTTATLESRRVDYWQQDGLRIIWAPSEDDRATALLQFRVGIADETLPQRGITHLLEHLVLGGQIDPHRNGSTGIAVTDFVHHGTQGEVMAFLSDLTQALSRPAWDRLDLERGILRAEQRSRGTTQLAQLFDLRYGATAHGLIRQDEHGVSTLTQQDLQTWLDGRFTADNAVLVLVSPQRPDAVPLRLPRGAAVPAPVPTPHADVPAYVHWASPDLGLIVDVPRTQAVTAFVQVLTRRAYEELRGRRGLCYSVGIEYLRLSSDRATLVIQLDSVPGMESECAAAFFEVLEGLADGPTPDEAAWLAQEAQRAVQSATPAAEARRLADDLLLGAPDTPWSDLSSSLARLTAADYRELVSTIGQEAIVALPHGAALDRPIPELKQRPAPAITGESFTVGDSDGSLRTLVIGADGLQLDHSQGWSVRLAFDRAVGLFRWPDGRRALVGPDGYLVDVEPTLYGVGEDRIAAIDAAVPADRHIPMPARADADIPRPVPAHSDRDRADLRSAFCWVAFLVVLAVLFVGLPIISVICLIRSWQVLRDLRAVGLRRAWTIAWGRTGV